MPTDEHQRITPHVEIDALMTATRWPDPVPATVLALVSQLLAANRHDDGHAHFAALASEHPDQPVFLAIACFFQAVGGHGTEDTLSALDKAVAAQAGLPHYFRGLVLAELPARAADAVADLQLVLSLGDRFPVGLRRAVFRGLATAYIALDRPDLAADALAKSGTTDATPQLVADYSVDDQHGFRFVPARIAAMADRVWVAQGYDFADIAFVQTDEGVVAIDAGSTPANARAALAAFREVSDRPITHIILTHAHWDHIGGLDALRGPDTQVIAQADFPAELATQNSIPLAYHRFAPVDVIRRQDVTPDLLVDARHRLTVGGTEFDLYPVRGGETEDALVVHVPDRGVVFAGDVMMPYLGAPFLPEGSADGLFDAMRLIEDLAPQLVIHGHPGLTAIYTIDVLPALRTALADLHRVVVAGLGAGATLGELLRRNHLPGSLADAPGAVIPYLVTRDNLIKRVHRQRTGYWQPDGDGVEHVLPAEWAAALDILAGGREQAFTDAVGELNTRGEHVLALKLADHALLVHPASTRLAALRQEALHRLMERHQGLNPFKFIVYSELAGVDLPAPE